MPDQDDDLPFGLYERLITASLKARLLQFDPAATRISTQGLDPSEAHATLARHVEDVVPLSSSDHEFHHAAAPTYRKMLERIKPKILLGLTATPERTDAGDILGYFDGQIAAELRLWDALERGLLCPFQYFGRLKRISRG